MSRWYRVINRFPDNSKTWDTHLLASIVYHLLKITNDLGIISYLLKCVQQSYVLGMTIGTSVYYPFFLYFIRKIIIWFFLLSLVFLAPVDDIIFIITCFLLKYCGYTRYVLYFNSIKIKAVLAVLFQTNICYLLLW